MLGEHVEETSLGRPSVVPALPAVSLPALPAAPRYLYTSGSEDRHITVRRGGAVTTSVGGLSVPVCLSEQLYTIPSIEAIKDMTERELERVDHFSIGHYAYGRVTWPGLTDVRFLNVDETVQFEEGAVVVYPDEKTKPELGKQLNKPAVIELTLKAGHAGAKKETYVAKLRQVTENMGALFISYDLETWRFRVEHFSRWGLASPEIWSEWEQDIQKDAAGFIPMALGFPGEFVADEGGKELEMAVEMEEQSSTADEDDMPSIPVGERGYEELQKLGWNLRGTTGEREGGSVVVVGKKCFVVKGSKINMADISGNIDLDAVRMSVNRLVYEEESSDECLERSISLAMSESVVEWLCAEARSRVARKFPNSPLHWLLVEGPRSERAVDVLVAQGKGSLAMQIAGNIQCPATGSDEAILSLLQGDFPELKNTLNGEWHIWMIGHLQWRSNKTPMELLIEAKKAMPEIGRAPDFAVLEYRVGGLPAVAVEGDQVKSWLLSVSVGARNRHLLSIDLVDKVERLSWPLAVALLTLGLEYPSAQVEGVLERRETDGCDERDLALLEKLENLK
jgi:hypothetical protein